MLRLYPRDIKNKVRNKWDLQFSKGGNTDFMSKETDLPSCKSVVSCLFLKKTERLSRECLLYFVSIYYSEELKWNSISWTLESGGTRELWWFFALVRTTLRAAVLCWWPIQLWGLLHSGCSDPCGCVNSCPSWWEYPIHTPGWKSERESGSQKEATGKSGIYQALRK